MTRSLSGAEGADKVASNLHLLAQIKILLYQRVSNTGHRSFAFQHSLDISVDNTLALEMSIKTDTVLHTAKTLDRVVVL